MMMAKYFLLAVSAALASASTAPTTQCTNSCNPIAKPGLQEAVPAGTPYSITWTPTTPGTVTIMLLTGPSTNMIPIGSLADKIANTGAFSWTPATTLKPGATGYGLQIINDADGTYQWSTQFGISNPSYSSASSSVISATSASSASSASSVAPSSVSSVSSISTHANIPSSSAAVSNGTISSSHSSHSISAPVFYSTGAPAANSSVVSPTVSMSVPSTLLSAAATSTLASGTTTSASAKPSGGAGQLTVSFGGAMVAIMGAVFAL